ncbi:hypothetical protein Tco_0179073 [Tanacetum coccineum]
MQLSELMNLCTGLQGKVLYLEKAKTAQAKEIASLKKRVKQLEKRRKLRTSPVPSDIQEDPVTICWAVVTTANVEATTANAPITTIDELTMD